MAKEEQKKRKVSKNEKKNSTEIIKDNKKTKSKGFKLKTGEKVLIGLVLITALGTLLLYYYLFGDKYYSFKTRWKIKMPSALEEVYSVKSKKDEFGDYNTYYIYKYEKEEDLENFVSWTTLSKETIQYDSYEETANQWLNVLSVDEKNRPSVDEALYYYKIDDKSNELLMIKDEKEKKIYLLEFIMKEE